MKYPLSNIILAVLFVAILVVSIVNTHMIMYNNSTLQTQNIEQDNQHKQDISALNNALNQTNSNINQSYFDLNKTYSDLNQSVNQMYEDLNQTYVDMQNLLSGKIDNLEARLPIEQYDYVIYDEWDSLNNVSVCFAKNGGSGNVDFSSQDASRVFNEAFLKGNNVFVKSGEYMLNSNFEMLNKKNARLDSDGAYLYLNGHKIIIKGDNFQTSQNNQISGLIIVDGTVRIENSFRSTITDMIFENCSVGVELANTNTWTEATRIDTVHFDKCIQGIVFRTNTSNSVLGHNSTGSYGNTEIRRAYFNLLDNSIAITVEQKAEFTDGILQNVRVWIGEFSEYNQTGLLMKSNSSMYQTLLDSVVFESFANGSLQNSKLYAISIDPNVYATPILQSGVSFLGSWTARINSNYNWIAGGGSVFRQENVAVPVAPFKYLGTPTVIQMAPSTISSFKPKITVQGSFEQNETVVVRITLEFVDNTYSEHYVEKSFTNSSSLWLSDDDLLQLFPSQNVIYAILVDAKVNSLSSDASVSIDLYGLTT